MFEDDGAEAVCAVALPGEFDGAFVLCCGAGFCGGAGAGAGGLIVCGALPSVGSLVPAACRRLAKASPATSIGMGGGGCSFVTVAVTTFTSIGQLAMSLRWG